MIVQTQKSSSADDEPVPKPKGTKTKSRCCCPKCLHKAQTDPKGPEKSDNHEPHQPQPRK